MYTVPVPTSNVDLESALNKLLKKYLRTYLRATVKPDYKDVLLLQLIRIIEALLDTRALTK
jgi:hypothetical protein